MSAKIPHLFEPLSPRYPLACRDCRKVRDHANHFQPPATFPDTVAVMEAMQGRYGEGTAEHAALAFGIKHLGLARKIP